VALNVTRAFPDATVELADARGVVYRERTSLAPGSTYHARARVAASLGPLTLAVLDRGGAEVLAHTEGRYDFLPDALIRTGPVPQRAAATPERWSEEDALAAGDELERSGAALPALAAYRAGLARFPASLSLERAAGRLAVTEMQYATAEPLLHDLLERVSSDHEAAYYLALARLALGDTVRARLLLEQAQQFGVLRPMATYWIAALDTRAGGVALAYARARRALQDAPRDLRLAGAAAMLARAGGRLDDARALLADARVANPVDPFLRWEAQLVGPPDPELMRELAADPERILEIATEYVHFGLWRDARRVLTTVYPTAGVTSEPGMPRPERYPLLAYYLGFVAERLGEDGAPYFRAASHLPTPYVFPSRPGEFAVLGAALARDPGDGTGHFLLGDVAMSGGMVDSAIAEWRRAAALQPGIPTLHRNLGYALLASGRPPAEARAVFEDGSRYDSLNSGVWIGLDSTLALLGAGVGDRARTLERFPSSDSMPTPLVYRLARLMAEAGRFDDAERQFRSRFFPRREGGVNPRQVWLEVRLSRAEALADAGRCAAARGILDGLDRPVPGVAFTQDGLGPFLEAGPLAERVAALRARCPA
jgi:tetratricopeptide (TPR) repeat protein